MGESAGVREKACDLSYIGERLQTDKHQPTTIWIFAVLREMSFQNWSFSKSVAALVSSEFCYCFLPKNIHTLREKRFFENKQPMLLNSLVERETCPI